MKIFSLLIGISLAVGAVAPTSGQDNLEQRKQACQKALDSDDAPFCFNKDEANAQYSVTHFAGDCQVQAVSDPAAWRGLVFKFARAGKEILVVKGHSESVFRANENKLFFADFPGGNCGCAVVAYNLDSGKEIWRTELEGVGTFSHSAYRNRVAMSLSRRNGKEDGTVFITGNESAGDYVEALDKTTGKQLAHRIYRQWGDWRWCNATAAEFAGSRDFENAKELQAKAIELAAKDKSATEKEKAELRSRLELYKQGKPYREEPKKKQDAR